MSEYTLPRLHPADLAALIDGVSERVIAGLLAATATDRTHGYLSIDEAAAELGVHRATLRRWELAGRLVPVRIGGVVRYRATDVYAHTAKADERAV